MNRKEKIFQYLSEYARIQTDSGFEPEADSRLYCRKAGTRPEQCKQRFERTCAGGIDE